MKSIIQEDHNCYIHKKLGVDIFGTDEHHMLHGTSRRKLAEEDGLKCFLCRTCHMALHDKGIYDLVLQQEAQKAWMDHYNKTAEDFIKRYGKNYL